MDGSDPAQNGEQIDPSTVKKALVLSAYRETDLDEPEHPTDFSLRYPEDEDYAADSDTMQTYCMEGTPYETPFTRSSAASLTDLREAGLESPKAGQDDSNQVMQSVFGEIAVQLTSCNLISRWKKLPGKNLNRRARKMGKKKKKKKSVKRHRCLVVCHRPTRKAKR